MILFLGNGNCLEFGTPEICRKWSASLLKAHVVEAPKFEKDSAAHMRHKSRFTTTQAKKLQWHIFLLFPYLFRNFQRSTVDGQNLSTSDLSVSYNYPFRDSTYVVQELYITPQVELYLAWYTFVFYFPYSTRKDLRSKVRKSLGFWELRTPCSAACGGKDECKKGEGVVGTTYAGSLPMLAASAPRCLHSHRYMYDSYTCPKTYKDHSQNVNTVWMICTSSRIHSITCITWRESGRARVGKITCKEGKYLLIPTPCKLNEWISKWWALQKTKSVTTCAYLGSLRHLS